MVVRFVGSMSGGILVHENDGGWFGRIGVWDGFVLRCVL